MQAGFFYFIYMALKEWFRNWLNVDDVLFNNTLNNLRYWDATPQFNEYKSDRDKLNIILKNPACLKVFALQCDLYSLGKVYVKSGDEYVDNDPFIDMIKNPNPFQSDVQLNWDYMFWNMLGNSYLYVDSSTVGNDNRLYFLENHKMEFPQEMMKYKDRIVLSQKEADKILDFDITYRYEDGTSTKLSWKNIIHIPDLTNGTGNWFKGNSRIDALFKVISNSEVSLDSKNVNILFAGKYMVAGTSDPSNVNEIPLSDKEKNDIESKIKGKKNVHAVKSMIDIKRFVENIANLKLDDSYSADYFTIGSMYGIPKDILEAYLSGKGSTWENKEKAIGQHVSYTLQPKGNAFYNALRRHFKYNKEIVIDWEHLPFMQVFAKERAEVERIKVDTLINLQRAGASLDQINKFLDTNFTELNPVSNETTQVQTGQEQRESNTNT